MTKAEERLQVLLKGIHKRLPTMSDEELGEARVALQNQQDDIHYEIEYARTNFIYGDEERAGLLLRLVQESIRLVEVKQKEKNDGA